MAIISLPKPKDVALGELAKAIMAERQAAESAAQTAIDHATRCGELLIQAKSKVKHGEWLSWLQTSCDLSERTAQGYMRLARCSKHLPENLSVRQALKALGKPKVSANTKRVADLAPAELGSASDAPDTAHVSDSPGPPMSESDARKLTLKAALADMIKYDGTYETVDIVADILSDLTGQDIGLSI